MDVFDIIGPIMIGPSSSHTAGACRIGKYARSILGEAVQKADIYFSGSFAKTYRGHGTDKAIVAGLMGMDTDEGLNVVNAEVPMAELPKYATELRSMTQGRGSFEVEFNRYEEVPGALAREIIAKHQAETEKE